MEITQDQFTANLQQMPQEAQVQVVQIIENNEPPALQAFAASLGVTLSTGEEQPMMPGERNLQEMQEFENRTDPDPDPDPDLSDPMANVGQVTAPEAQPATAPLQDQMQKLAMGDQVAGMIDQPGAENQTGVADDVPMNVREGAYIVNAAAIAKVGKKDFEERIIEPAIEYLKEKDGVEIDKAAITKPAQQVNGDQKILASNKEYHIPPELAEVIGTDLLDKINKRGEAETEKKLEEQEQQPQQKQEVPIRANKGTPGGISKKKVDLEKEVGDLVNKYFPAKQFPSAYPAIMGNIYEESKFDNTAKQVNGNAVGLLQMEPPMRNDYENFIRNKRIKDTADSQLLYLKEQTDKGTYIGSGNAQRITAAFKLPATEENVRAATISLMGYKGQKGKQGFFNPGKPREQERIKKAFSYMAAPRPKRKPPLPAQQTQTNNIRVSPESVNRSFMAESPDLDPRLRTQTQPPAN